MCYSLGNRLTGDGLSRVYLPLLAPGNDHYDYGQLLHLSRPSTQCIPSVPPSSISGCILTHNISSYGSPILTCIFKAWSAMASLVSSIERKDCPNMQAFSGSGAAVLLSSVCSCVQCTAVIVMGRPLLYRTNGIGAAGSQRVQHTTCSY